jgi:SAM-dependent methyltransferase
MNLMDVVRRRDIPEPWVEGEKLAWNEPDFSRRMLREHLSQDHDGASRRFELIDKHVEWIHRRVLSGVPNRVLDLGCGPGLYTSRLSKLGHECVGIDFAPASIAYAREQAKQAMLRCTYLEEDIRVADYGTGFGLVMLIHGEFNAFRTTDARVILERAHRALADNGILLLEPHTFRAVQEMGERPFSWYSAQRGLFSDQPHICLQEAFWDAECGVATERHFVIDALTGEVTRHAWGVQGYTEEGYRSILEECGFGGVEFHASLRGEEDEFHKGLVVIVSRKQHADQ